MSLVRFFPLFNLDLDSHRRIHRSTIVLLGFLVIFPHQLYRAPRLTHALQATRSSDSLHMSVKLSAANFFTSFNHVGIPRDPPPPTFPCKMVFARVPFVPTAISSELSPAANLTSRCAVKFPESLVKITME